MEIKFRTFLPILIFYFLEYSLVQAVENVVTYTAKSREVLECSFTTSVVQWNELRDDGSAIALFSYDVSNAQAINLTSDRKYDNFDYSVEETNGFNGFNLVITNIDKHDGGRYQCSPFSATPQIFSVTVEVLPHFISINCTELNVCTSSAERETAAQIACVCMATGLNSKTLELEWEAIGVLTTSNTTRVMDPTSGTVSIRSETTLLPPNETSSVSCSLTGYESQIPERLRSYTYSFSPPVCNLVHDCTSDGMDAVLTCNCSDGSPKISAYSFYNSQMSPIGTQFYSSSTLKVETDGKVTFYCSGCNGVMHDQIVGYEFNCKQAGYPLNVVTLCESLVKSFCLASVVDTELDKDAAAADDKILKNGSAAPWIVIIIGGFLLVLVVAAIICCIVKKHWCSKGKGVGSKRKQDGDRWDAEHPLYDNTAAQDQKLHDPRSKDPKAIKPDVSTSGCPATKDKDKQFIADDIPEYADVNK
ncbi:hypothetical protein HOLleu_42549 [Holothuria leucospilota]|uniref:Ig-like domain-containing protein n=1 Tax=Holothuria leucospilota TaxID=206669 RepID=A0A9Q1B9A5_HOLLE|nr:hypothetical protein HOLleu_42549 [Holothuria leucospilota]